MNNSNESGATTPRLFLTEDGACFNSPIVLFSDQGSETPHKLPVAPHPSPINMDVETSNPKSKEVFRTELLKACQLKIPEAIAKASDFDDDVLANLSYTEEDVTMAVKPICIGHQNKEKVVKTFDYFPGDGNSNNLGQSQADRDIKQSFRALNAKDGNSISDSILKFESHSSNFHQNSRFIKESENVSSRITYSTGNVLECLDEECSNSPKSLIFTNQLDAIPNFKKDYASDIQPAGESQGPRITYSNENLPECPNGGGKSAKIHFDPRPPTLNLNLLDSMHRKEGASVFYDHTTDHIEISKLLEVTPGWQDTSTCRSRSPCSDKMSTVAFCSSDASDISDGDLMDRDGSSMDFDEKEPEDKVDLLRERRPPKKQPSKSSAMRRFLNWRRTLKFRKRTASLDESQFPFFANRLDSYKTEFEVSV